LAPHIGYASRSAWKRRNARAPMDGKSGRTVRPEPRLSGRVLAGGRRRLTVFLHAVCRCGFHIPRLSFDRAPTMPLACARRNSEMKGCVE
jgi:hypothetical protein